jgi:LysR family transcriptional regulator, regulator for genes of the gallate degradation pathway
MSAPNIPSFRRLLVFDTVARTENVSRAAAAIHVSQPAVTQAIAGLEREIGATLFRRRNTGCYLTEDGEILQRRTARLFAQLDQALAELVGIPRPGSSDVRSVKRKLSQPQVRALVAVAENGSFAAAARALGTSEASIHRAARELERVLRRPLFHRTARGLTATKPAAELARRVRLAVQELERAVEEIAASHGRNCGRIGLGLLPLSGAFFVARALKDLGEAYPDTRIEVIDGSFDVLIEKLQSGGIDFIIGPVRGLDPSLGVVETVLFDDRYAVVVRRGHPLTRKRQIRRQDLLAFDWVAPPPDTPRRVVYDSLFAGLGRMPRSTLQTSSPNLTRAILTETDRITLLSRYESRAEQEMGFLTVLPFAVPHEARQVQVTTRADWLPTAVQARFLQALHDHARGPEGTGPVALPKVSGVRGASAVEGRYRRQGVIASQRSG